MNVDFINEMVKKGWTHLSTKNLLEKYEGDCLVNRIDLDSVQCAQSPKIANLSLEEALQSGKLFKREKDSRWAYIDNNRVVMSQRGHQYVFFVEDLLARDWMTGEDRVEITLSQLETALSLGIDNKAAIAKALGFKP